MNNDIYKMMEELHEKVKPLRKKNTWTKFNSAIENIASGLRLFSISCEEAEKSIDRFSKAYNQRHK